MNDDGEISFFLYRFLPFTTKHAFYISFGFTFGILLLLGFITIFGKEGIERKGIFCGKGTFKVFKGE